MGHICKGYLVTRLVGGGHHHRVAEGQRDKEIHDVAKVGGQLGHGLAVEAHEVHLTAAFIDFVHQLRVGRDVLLLRRGGTLSRECGSRRLRRTVQDKKGELGEREG